MARKKRYTPNQQEARDLLYQLEEEGLDWSSLPELPSRITKAYLQYLRDLLERVKAIAHEGETMEYNMRNLITENIDRWGYGTECLDRFEDAIGRWGVVDVMLRIKQLGIKDQLLSAFATASFDSERPAFIAMQDFMALMDAVDEANPDLDQFFIEDNELDEGEEDELEAEDEGYYE